jgi:hypothetical protein
VEAKASTATESVSEVFTGIPIENYASINIYYKIKYSGFLCVCLEKNESKRNEKQTSKSHLLKHLVLYYLTCSLSFLL